MLIAGVDEAGRGPLAGPVYAAAVILDPNNHIQGLNDSKKLTEKKREQLQKIIFECALAWSVAKAEVEEIDSINILQASLLAMKRAVEALKLPPKLVLVDGDHAPKLNCKVKTIIGGDASEPAISAASILAKVARDACMLELHQQYPDYGFADHKGYGTKQHLEALKKYGATPIHRRTFRPVLECL